MFSRRLPWPCPPNRLSRLLEERRAQGRRVLDLTESNPTRIGLDYPSAEIASALSRASTASYEPDPRGLSSAREAVSDYYGRRGMIAPSDRIILTASTSEAYSLIFKLLADAGETVLTPRPSYPLFEYLAALEWVSLDHYPIVHDGRWAIDLPAIERQTEGDGSESPRAVVIVNPNNPTGSALRARERVALESICASRDLAIISDEVFWDYLFDPPPDERVVSMLDGAIGAARSAPALTFTLGGLSKSCGLPQMKLGWVVVGGPEESAREAIERLEIITDTYLSVGSPVQRATPRLLEIGGGIQKMIRTRVKQNRSSLAAAIGAASPCRILDGDGGWYTVIQVPAMLPEEELVLRLLDEDDVLVHPGYFFDFPREAFLILSLLPAPTVFCEGLGRILPRVGAGG